MEREEVLIALGERIRYWRQARGYSQQTLGDMVGTSKTCLSGVENGKRNPSVAWLAHVARCLNISLEELFRGL